MVQETMLDLPLELGDGLLLRWGRPEDADKLAAFNIRLHSDNADAPDEWLGAWTRDLLSGKHPTTSADFFTVVEDMSSGALVSSQVLIPQTWYYEDIPFGVGRPELIATDEAYRRRGLIRRQMEVAHALSAQIGHLVQAITGIPWFYRQFGYEMAINLGGGRDFFWSRPENNTAVGNENYQMRPAKVEDIPRLNDLYLVHCANSLIRRERTEAIWRYELESADSESIAFLNAHLISDEAGEIVAYVTIWQHGTAFTIRELGVVPGHSWRSIALFVAGQLKRRAKVLNKEREKPITRIRFEFDDNHQVVGALGGQLEKRRNPYAWYIRVPDLHGFMQHISPVLERRLGESVAAGYTGTLRLNFYRDALQITLEEGKIIEIDRYEPKDWHDAGAVFPNLTFLQLLFGYRSLEELDTALADCFPLNEEAAVLLKALFPKRPSYITALN
jgi:GNAT superfamily N-acetyltransferase